MDYRLIDALEGLPVVNRIRVPEIPYPGAGSPATRARCRLPGCRARCWLPAAGPAIFQIFVSGKILKIALRTPGIKIKSRKKICKITKIIIIYFFIEMPPV